MTNVPGKYVRLSFLPLSRTAFDRVAPRAQRRLPPFLLRQPLYTLFVIAAVGCRIPATLHLQVDSQNPRGPSLLPPLGAILSNR